MAPLSIWPNQCVDQNVVNKTVCIPLWLQNPPAALRQTLEVIRNAGLTARPSKCLIGYETVKFVGHQVEKVRLRWRQRYWRRSRRPLGPKTKSQVRSFVNLAGWCMKFIPQYATIAAPLTDLTKKCQPNLVRWGEPQEHTFQTLKRMLAQPRS